MSVFVLQSKTITGQANQPTPQDVDKAVKTALKSKGFDYEIAFFGGSFTAIDREYMIFFESGK